MEKQFRYSSGCYGPRWERLGPFIKQVAAATGCTIIELLNDPGWIFESITFTIEGTDQQTKDFIYLYKKGLEQ